MNFETRLNILNLILATEKNNDFILLENRCLPTNAFERDLNDARISAVCNMVKSCLRLKEAMRFYCEIFEAPSF